MVVLKKYYAIRITALFILLWGIFCIKAIFAPSEIEFIGNLFDGIRIVEPVRIKILSSSKDILSNTRVYRLDLLGHEHELMLYSENSGIYKENHKYWRDIIIKTKTNHINDIVAEVWIGSNRVHLPATHPFVSPLQYSDSEWTEIRYINGNLDSPETIIPLFSRLLNYRGDGYFLKMSLFFAILAIAIAWLTSAYVRMSSRSIDLDYISVILCSVLVIKMIVGHFPVTILFPVVIDFLIIFMVTIYVTVLNDNCIVVTQPMRGLGRISILRLLTVTILVVVFSATTLLYFFHREATLDEGKYLIRGYWYIHGDMKPYSPMDGNWYAPVYFILIGLWQHFIELFTMNSLLSNRLFSFVLTIVNTLFIIKLFKKSGIGEKWTYIGMFLYITIPFGGLMYNYTHPTVFINTLLLALALLVLQSDEYSTANIAVGSGVLYVLLFFTRKNTILIIPWIFIFQIFYSKERLKSFLLTALVYFILSFAILSAFPSKLSYVMVSLPKIKNIVYSLGILDQDSIPGPKNIIRDSVPGWNPRDRINFLKSVQLRFWSFSNRYYLIDSLLCFFALVLPKNNNKEGRYAVYTGVVFIISAVLHAIGATIPANVFGYMHYFFSYGIIAATFGLKSMYEIFSTKGLERNRILLSVLLIHTLLFFSRSIYKEYVSPYAAHHQESIKAFQRRLSEYNIYDEKILVIDTNHYIATLATHFAGGVPEAASLNLPYSHKKVRAPYVDSGRKEFEERNYWSDEIMRSWIQKEKSIIVLYNEDKYAPHWGQLIEEYFQHADMFYFPDIGWYSIYTRN